MTNTASATTLAPGISTTCTGSHTTVQADVDAGMVINTASVAGTAPNGQPTSPVTSNTVSVAEVRSPAPTIVKATTTTGVTAVGEIVPYTFSSTNTGNVVMSAITSTGPNEADIVCPGVALAPGTATTCTASHTVTQADLDSGRVVNIAPLARRLPPL